MSAILTARRGGTAGKPIISAGSLSPVYTETASWATQGSAASGNAQYKDVAVANCAVGDLLIAYSIAENAQSGTRSTATQTGTAGRTGTWTMSTPTLVNNSDVAAAGAYALVTTAGTVTVRTTLQVVTTSNHLGAAVIRIPAANVGATYGWATTIANDADGQGSVTLSGNSFVLYFAGDWSNTALGATPATTPTTSTIHKAFSGSGDYSVLIVSWQNQASGTRNYGPSGLSGKDFTGSIFRMDM